MPITPLPALSRSSPTFRAEVDQLFLTDLPNFSVEAEAARLQVVAAETASAASALAGGLSQVAAAASELAAQGYAQTALNAPGTSATSTTSHDISVGPKTYTIQTGKLFVPGQRLTIARTSAPVNVNYARVETYNPGTGALAVTVDSAVGAGTGITDWTIAVSGTPAQAGGVGSVSYTGLSATKALVSTDAGAVYLTSTVPITVTMPAANTLGSTKLFVMKNGGSFDMTVTDSTGGPLAALRAKSALIVWGQDLSTAAGVWATYEAGALYAGVQTAVDPDAVLQSSAAYQPKVCSIGTDKALVVYRQDSNALPRARVLSHSGDSVTVGAEFSISATVYNEITVCRLTTDKAIVFYANGTDGRARVLSVSGTTITGGTEVTVNSGNTTSISLCQVATDKAIVFYRDNTASQGQARALSVSTTTITQGTEFVVNAATVQYTAIAQLATDKAVAVYYDSTASELQARVLSVSTTTITGGTEVTIQGGSQTYDLSICQVTTDIAALAFSVSDGAFLQVLSASGTTLTVGAATTLVDVSGTSPAAAASSIVAFDSTKLGFVSYFSNTSTDGVYGVCVDLSGATVTRVSNYALLPSFTNGNPAYLAPRSSSGAHAIANTTSLAISASTLYRSALV